MRERALVRDMADDDHVLKDPGDLHDGAAGKAAPPHDLLDAVGPAHVLDKRLERLCLDPLLLGIDPSLFLGRHVSGSGRARLGRPARRIAGVGLLVGRRRVPGFGLGEDKVKVDTYLDNELVLEEPQDVFDALDVADAATLVKRGQELETQ